MSLKLNYYILCILTVISLTLRTVLCRSEYKVIMFLQIHTQIIRVCLISCFQPNALVYYIFSYCSTCFEPYCAHHEEVLLYIYSIWFFMCHSSCVTVRCTGTACAPNGHTRRVTHKEPDAVYTSIQ